MAITPILAMTAAEMQNFNTLPSKIAWMACHFSSSGPSLSNLPEKLPAGSLLILDDSTPIHGHDPELIRNQLAQFDADAVLLDFQRPDHDETTQLVNSLSESLPCPVIVSDLYGKGNTLPVFLPPVPPSVSLQEWFSPWQGRQIWLDIAPSCEILRLTEHGCQICDADILISDNPAFTDEILHCHYQILPGEDHMDFVLWRTTEDLKDLLSEAEALGIQNAVGLWQELEGFR